MRAGSVWLLVVAIFVFGCKDREKSARDKALLEAKLQAEQAVARAAQDAKEAKAALERAKKDLSDMDGQVAEAITAVADAPNDADRASAKYRLIELQRKQADLRSRIAAATLAVEHVPTVQEAEIAAQQSDQLRKTAEQQAAQAVKDAQEAKAALERATQELSDLDGKVTAAVTAVADAQNDADRASAKARLIALQREQAELKSRLTAATLALQKAESLKGVTISKECKDNPLAKGCS